MWESFQYLAEELWFHFIIIFLLCISELYFSDLTYKDIYGEISGVQDLSLGQNVNFVIGEHLCI